MLKNNHNLSSKIIFLTSPYVWLLTFTFLPLIIIAAISLSEQIFGAPPFELFFQIGQEGEWIINPYLENFKAFFNDSFYIKSFQTSFIIASFSTLICLIIGYPMAYYISKMPKSLHAFLLILVILPFWTPSLIRVYSLMTILKSNGFLSNFLQYCGLIKENKNFLNSYFAVIVGISYAYLPFMVIPIYLALEKINPKLYEAASDLGCRPHKIFTSITLPLSLSGVSSGIMLVFVPAIGEFVIPDILGGARILTIGRVIWNEFFQNRDWPMASAITIVIVFAIIIPVMLLQKHFNRENV